MSEPEWVILQYKWVSNEFSNFLTWTSENLNMFHSISWVKRMLEWWPLIEFRNRAKLLSERNNKKLSSQYLRYKMGLNAEEAILDPNLLMERQKDFHYQQFNLSSQGFSILVHHAKVHVQLPCKMVVYISILSSYREKLLTHYFSNSFHIGSFFRVSFHNSVSLIFPSPIHIVGSESMHKNKSIRYKRIVV